MDRLFPVGSGETDRGGRLALAGAFSGRSHSALNHVHAEFFDSTNWTVDPSPMRALPVFLTLTNGLIQ